MMSSTNEEDPFLQVQQDVEIQLASARQLFTSYLRIRSLNTTQESPELSSARSDLESALSTLDEDLADLSAAVQAVESNPSSFGLNAAEVTRRKRIVQDMAGEMEDMRDELSKKHTPSQHPGGAAGPSGSSDLPHPSSFAIGDEAGGADDDDTYAEFEQRQQALMMREQDQHLDGVFNTVGNLRRQADDMGRELEEQREMLEVVDNAADRLDGRLQTGMQKLQYVMRRNEDTLSSCCIAILITALIILLVLLLVL